MSQRRTGLFAAWRTSIDQELRRRRSEPADKRALSDDEWAALLEDGTNLDQEPSSQTVAKIAARVSVWRRVAFAERANGRRERFVVASQPGPREADWNEEGVSDLLAAHAAQETDQRFGVRDFRADVLGDRLLTLSDAPQWIRSLAERERPSEPPEPRAGARGTRVMTLAFASPNSDFMQRVVVAPRGTLERLRTIARRLADFYPWDEAQATTFVLTGVTPLVQSIRGNVTISSPLLVRSAVTLTIHPSSTPREVADYYGRVRRANFGRVRRLGERHARLAVFAAQLPQHLSPADQMRRWNEQCLTWKKRKWQFRYPSRFATEAQRAVDRLVELGHG